MFITPQELKDLLYEYQVNQITDNDSDIVDDAINAAISEVRSYFEAANQRRETANLTIQQYNAWKIYDVDAIFSATGSDRDPYVTRLCLRIAAFNVCELSNVDIDYDRLRQIYDQTVTTLEKIAGMGQYALFRLVLTQLPSPQSETTAADAPQPFRMASRPKFHHE